MPKKEFGKHIKIKFGNKDAFLFCKLQNNNISKVRMHTYVQTRNISKRLFISSLRIRTNNYGGF